MLRINFITLGKLKEKYWREAEAEYLKRMSSFAKITIHELKEESFGRKDSPDIIKRKEAEKILSTLKKKDGLIVVLDEHGLQFSSIAFAKQIKPAGKLIFIIGGPLGLDESILKLAGIKLSLSPMTFTHQMARVILWEQIYRAMMINSKRRYHY